MDRDVPEDLDAELRMLTAVAGQRDELARGREQIARQIAALEQRRFGWQQAVGDASAALERLERFGLLRLFHAVRGDRRRRLEDERAKLAEARLRHDECDAELTPLLAEQARIDTELRGVDRADARLAELVRAKAAALEARGGVAAERLLQSARLLGDLGARHHEIEQAVAAGRLALGELEATESELRGARWWGRIDMLRGGLLSGMAKHADIQGARSHAERAQRHVREFVQLLGAAGVELPSTNIEVGALAKLGDLFLDCLISDWLVQSKILDALVRVTHTREAVQELVWSLEREQKQLQQQLAAAERERAAWIGRAG